MKPIEQMTKEELTNLLFYEHTNGTRIALSKIKAIRPTSIDVEGYTTSTTISSDVYTTLMGKLQTYEAYKLTSIKENLLKIQEEQLEATFNVAFENTVNSLASKLFKKLTYLENVELAANTAKNSLEDSITKFGSILAEATDIIKDTSKNFTKEVNNLNLDSINSQISSKLKTFSNYLGNLEDPTIEINKMSKLLREIFSEELVDKREP